MHENSLKICKMLIDKHLDYQDKLSVADVGSMDINGTYKPLMSPNWTYVGIDVSPGPNVDLIVPPWMGNFDVVISGQCLEHVRKPWVWIKDVCKILKDDGLIILIAPNTWGFHEFPIDCWRIWPDGMVGLFEEGGIKPLTIGKSGNDTFGVGRLKWKLN